VPAGHRGTYIEDEVVGELEVGKVAIQETGEDLGVGGRDGELVDGSGQIVVADANVLLQVLVNLVDQANDLVRGQLLDLSIGTSLHAECLAASVGLDVTASSGEGSTGAEGL
jgi:hypothetical protein